MPPKKRQRTDGPLIPHSQCKLHADTDNRKTICNATKTDGTRCVNKVKPAKASTALESGFLPLCKVHDHKKLRIGYCEAKSACGERCNRLCVRDGACNQLCCVHIDVELPNRLSTLPLELRMGIYNLLIPSGSIPAGPPRRYIPYYQQRPTPNKKVYSDAASPLRVDKATNAAVTTLLYQSSL
ncbi:hypothetical protein EJ08DRAFT_475777 [Tothia fuscella]|uniref:Uncharacterized protein n=1 Tax=Tothia fuscella TaxID=1048955 RepID=A0A9P4TUS1_9PEZI|nr:hypothetical protein EJ08DRAFT_475777 [Tothia fuscella]